MGDVSVSTFHPVEVYLLVVDLLTLKLRPITIPRRYTRRGLLLDCHVISCPQRTKYSVPQHSAASIAQSQPGKPDMHVYPYIRRNPV